jgi:hypothetical protein
MLTVRSLVGKPGLTGSAAIVHAIKELPTIAIKTRAIATQLKLRGLLNSKLIMTSELR